MLREMQREVNTGRPVESRLHIDNNHSSQLSSASDFDCRFMAVFSCRKPAGPRIMRKLWSNLREQGNEQKLKENISFPRGIESQLRATAQRIYSKSDVDNAMIAPQDYDVRQSRRVLEFHNRDLWIRPTDLSWHVPILVTLREEPFY